MQNLVDAFDREHLWHPYTSLSAPLPAFKVEKAAGVMLHLADGSALIDGMASWWSVIHGYAHPILNQSLRDQLDRMAHVMFGGLTHEAAINLGQRLVDLLPPTLNRIFFADAGSVAVEVALKMAVQYQYSRGLFQKHHIATTRRGYHGDTWNAMSVCDPTLGMHHMFGSALPRRFFVDAPQSKFHQAFDSKDLLSVKKLFDEHGASIAAFIVEPVVQGAGGMFFYHPNYLVGLRKLCDEYGILLIFDEIATGFGRTGELFAFHIPNVLPDILCLGKALTGGYMTLAACIAREHVAQTISAGEPGVFMHGPTFMANPLACAVASASIDVLLSYNWQEKVKFIQTLTQESLHDLAALPHVQDVRVLGAIGVVELKHPVDLSAFQVACWREKVWIRPFGKLVYIMPPYIISRDELETLLTKMSFIISKLQH